MRRIIKTLIFFLLVACQSIQYVHPSNVTQVFCHDYSNDCYSCVISPLSCDFCYISGTCAPHNTSFFRLTCDSGCTDMCPIYYPSQINTIPNPGAISLPFNWNIMQHGPLDNATSPLGILPIDGYAFVMGLGNSLPYQLHGMTGILYDITSNAQTYDAWAHGTTSSLPSPSYPPGSPIHWYNRTIVSSQTPFASQLSTGTPNITITPTTQIGILYAITGTDALWDINVRLTRPDSNDHVLVNVSNIYGMAWNNIRHGMGSVPWPCQGCTQRVLGEYAGIHVAEDGTISNTTLGIHEVIFTYNDILTAPWNNRTADNTFMNNSYLTWFTIGPALPYGREISPPAYMLLSMSYAIYCYPTQYMMVTQIDGTPLDLLAQKINGNPIESNPGKGLVIVNTHGSVTCQQGYGVYPRNMGNIAICTSDGTLMINNTITSCTPYICPHLTIPHGTVSAHNATESYGTTVQITCDGGYVILGSLDRITTTTATCGADVWSNVTCARECPAPIYSHSSYPPRAIQYIVNTQVTLTCDPGWGYPDPTTTITCGVDGTWGTPPICHQVCSLPNILPQGLSNLTATNYLIGDTVVFTCSDMMYIPSHNMTCTCSDNTTSIHDITCANSNTSPHWDYTTLPTCTEMRTTSNSSSSTSMTPVVIPIVFISCISILILLLLYSRYCIPIHGVRLEPGHVTWFPILSTSVIHQVMTSSIIRILPFVMSCIQCGVVVIMLCINTLSQPDNGGGVSLIGSCDASLSSFACSLMHATSTLTLIYLILALVSSSCFILVLIITYIRSHALIYTMISYRMACFTHIIMSTAVLIWLLGPYQIISTYHHTTLTPIFIVGLITCIISWGVLCCHFLHMEHTPMGKPGHEGIPSSESMLQLQPVLQREGTSNDIVIPPPVPPPAPAAAPPSPTQSEREPEETWQMDDISSHDSIPLSTNAVVVLSVEPSSPAHELMSPSHPFSAVTPPLISAPVTQLNIGMPSLNARDMPSSMMQREEKPSHLSPPPPPISPSPRALGAIGGIELWSDGRVSLGDLEAKEGMA